MIVLPIGILVVLEREGNIGAGGCGSAAGPSPIGRQDDILGEGDVEAAVLLDTRGPCEIGEVHAQPISAQVVSTRIRHQPAYTPAQC